ncbi:MAG: 50S ribosomal protein L25 [Myxococcota bacterium]
MEAVLQVSPRDAQGKGASRKARADGKVPAVVYGPAHEAQSVTIDPVELVELFKTSRNRNTIVSVVVDGAEGVPCLVREVQRHPLSRDILHVDFFAVPREEEIEVMVPIRPVGRPAGAQLGGRLRLIRREVKVTCRYDRIPEAIEVDSTPLDIGQFVKASQMPLPEGVSLVSDHDFNVVSVVGKKVKGGGPAAEPTAAG